MKAMRRLMPINYSIWSKKQHPRFQCPEIVVLLDDAQQIDVELANFGDVDQKLRET